MEKSALDLDKLQAMLFNILLQMDSRTFAEVASLQDLAGLQNMILDTLGIPQGSLSLPQQEELTALVRTVVVNAARARKAGSGEM